MKFSRGICRTRRGQDLPCRCLQDTALGGGGGMTIPIRVKTLVIAGHDVSALKRNRSTRRAGERHFYPNVVSSERAFSPDDARK